MNVWQNWNSEALCLELEDVSRRLNCRSSYVISDNTSVMNKGIKDFNVSHIRNISHTLGMFMERVYKKLEALARSRYLLFKNLQDWTNSQQSRANALFEKFPEIKKVYDRCWDCAFGRGCTSSGIWWQVKPVGIFGTRCNLVPTCTTSLRVNSCNLWQQNPKQRNSMLNAK